MSQFLRQFSGDDELGNLEEQLTGWQEGGAAELETSPANTG